MVKDITKFIAPLIGLCMMLGLTNTVYAALGDASNFVLTDSLGRSWYKPFDGLINKVATVQIDTLNGTEFTAAKMSEVASMYCEIYESTTSPCTTDETNFGANNFQDFLTDFGFGIVGVDTIYARVVSETGGVTGDAVGTNAAGCPTSTYFCQLLNSTLVTGTNNIKIGTQEARYNYGMMYYKAAAPTPSMIGLLTFGLLFMGWLSIKRK